MLVYLNSSLDLIDCQPFQNRFPKTTPQQVFIRDCSVVSGMALLLFGGPLAVLHEEAQLLVGGWLRIKAAAQVWLGGFCLLLGLLLGLRLSWGWPRMQAAARARVWGPKAPPQRLVFRV
jgi:hypothetical protein